MNTSKSGEPYGTPHMIERQMLFWSARDRAGREVPLERPRLKYRFLTISREVGSLGDEIASELAGHLGWRVFDREIVDYIAENSHVRQNLVLQLDEKTQSLIHDTVQRILRLAEGGSFGMEEYHQSLLRTLAFLAARGEAILVGRGANFVLRGGDGLHARITASRDVRVQRLCREWQVTMAEATQRVEIADSDRRNFVRHHFRSDADDVSCYDLTVCTDNLSVQQVTAALLVVMQAPGSSP